MSEQLIRVTAYFAGFAISLYALTALDFSRFLRKNKTVPAQILMLLLAMAIGTLVAQFLLALRVTLN
ncbi:MAG: DUF1146 domain-containing protein [Erysipelotrichaceae bacterium]